MIEKNKKNFQKIFNEKKVMNQTLIESRSIIDKI